MATTKQVAIPGSKVVPFQNARAIAAAAPDERLEVTVRVRPRNALPDAAELLKPSSGPRRYMTHQQYEKLYAADPRDLARVRKFAKDHNLIVVRESAARRSVMLAGTVADFNKAFGVSLKVYAHATGTYRGRVGTVKVPAELGSIIAGVFGLDTRPIAKPHFRVASESSQNAAAAHPFNPNDVAAIYDFPPGTDGTGQTIGIIELGGGYRPQDLETYFQGLGISTPTVIPVSVDGASNAPTNASGDDVEVALDIEVAGAVAPGATIVVYFAPNSRTSKGFLDAITKAVHDTTNNPSVISISWGGPEEIPNSSFQTQFDEVLQAAALLGITVCVAAGDNGAADMGPNVWDGKAHVDFPSASPFALACGGTRLVAAQVAIQSETIWNQHSADTSPDAGPDGSFGASGGGVSGAFPIPNYQQNAGVPASLNPTGYQGRGVPDVTGAGDPDTGYNVLVDGQAMPVGGTSAVAPLWAGLIARMNQKLNGRVGFINPQIYALPAASAAFHDVTQGDNRVSFNSFNNVGYDAGPGWDACSGLGSPDGANLVSQLTVSKPSTAAQAAGTSLAVMPKARTKSGGRSPMPTRKQGSATKTLVKSLAKKTKRSPSRRRYR